MNQNNKEITLKQCPLCKAPILKTQRFMNQVKIILKDISEIKVKLRGEISVLKSHEKKVLQSLKSLNENFTSVFIGDVFEYNHTKNLWDIFCGPLIKSFPNKHKKHKLHPRDIESLEFVIKLLNDTSKYKERIETIDDTQMKQTIIDHFVYLLNVAFSYACKLSNQQKFDINMELSRGVRIIYLFEIKTSETFRRIYQSRDLHTLPICNLIHLTESLLMSCKPYNQEMDTVVQNYFEQIQQKMENIPVLTNKEKQMIHAAMAVDFFGDGRAQGHWYKCSNGHIYCITECGGPMEQSVCPECKVKIGGSSHQHVAGVSVASEMFLS